MNYSDAQNNIARTKIDKIIIKQDYCANTFGVLPCTATGTQCYNTFPTCKDKINYNKTTKDYEFVSGDINAELARKLFPALPYLKSVNDIPTEIKETDTVVKILKATLLDEPDEDIGNDPYYKERSSVQGKYWRKWLARNKNYKGRTIELQEGFAVGSELSDFQRKFIGRIENIKVQKNSVIFEATDMLKKLSEFEYPLESKYSLQEELSNIFRCGSQNEMLTLNAKVGDFAERQDFLPVSGFTAVDGVDPNGELLEGTYFFKIYAYDSENRVLARADATGSVTSQGNLIDLSWNALTGASYYQIYKSSDSNNWVYHGQTTNTSEEILNLDGTFKIIPTNAERIFQLVGGTSSDINDWQGYYNDMTIKIDANSDLDSSGYIMIDKEAIYYDSKNAGSNTDILGGIKRHQYNTEPDRHNIYSKLHYLFNEAPGNPFTHLKKILNRAGIDSYAATNFATYESNWTGINFSCNVIIKKTKLSKIYFNLVNALDCISWVGEDGEIKLLKRTETPGTYTEITDKANIIEGSGAVDLNEASRKTSWFAYWDKWDVEAGIDEDAAYSYGINLIDADAEISNSYGERVEDIQHILWLNNDCGTRDDIESYILSLLHSKQTRTVDAQKLYDCTLEMKDGGIKTGELIKLSTNDIQNTDGSAISKKIFRVIKKAVKKNKINITLEDSNYLAA